MDYANDSELDTGFEQSYQAIILRFISQETTVDTFVNAFIARWQIDRDVDVSDSKFRRMIDRLFTSCDCYDAFPNRTLGQITEAELRNEVELLSHIWWDLSSFDSSVEIKI